MAKIPPRRDIASIMELGCLWITMRVGDTENKICFILAF